MLLQPLILVGSMAGSPPSPSAPAAPPPHSRICQEAVWEMSLGSGPEQCCCASRKGRRQAWEQGAPSWLRCPVGRALGHAGEAQQEAARAVLGSRACRRGVSWANSSPVPSSFPAQDSHSWVPAPLGSWPSPPQPAHWVHSQVGQQGRGRDLGSGQGGWPLCQGCAGPPGPVVHTSAPLLQGPEGIAQDCHVCWKVGCGSWGPAGSSGLPAQGSGQPWKQAGGSSGQMAAPTQTVFPPRRQQPQICPAGGTHMEAVSDQGQGSPRLEEGQWPSGPAPEVSDGRSGELWPRP